MKHSNTEEALRLTVWFAAGVLAGACLPLLALVILVLA